MPVRVTRRLLAASALVASVLALPAPAAFAQSDPFAPNPLITPDKPDVSRQPVAPGFEEEDEGFSTGEEILIFAGGLLVLGGIAAAIVIDARRRRPRAEAELRGGRADDEGHDSAHRRAENRRRRAKAKQARASRKRNRPKR